MSKVRIVMTGHGRGEVFVDGAKIPAVVAVSASVRAGPHDQEELNTVRIELQPESIEIEGEFEVTTIESASREFRRGTPANADGAELAKAG